MGVSTFLSRSRVPEILFGLAVTLTGAAALAADPAPRGTSARDAATARNLEREVGSPPEHEPATHTREQRERGDAEREHLDRAEQETARHEPECEDLSGRLDPLRHVFSAAFNSRANCSL